MEKNNVLFIDDDGDLLLSLTRTLKVKGLEASVHGASTAEKGFSLLEQLRPEVAVVDLCLNEKEGIESGFRLLERIVAADNSCRVIVLTGHGGIEPGVRALQTGAASFVEKPPDIDHLLALLRDGIKQAQILRAHQELKKQTPAFAGGLLAGVSRAWKELEEQLRYAAFGKQNVLLSGETGTGKGVCARAIHALSNSSEQEFVRYQPTLGSPDLVQSDLFGHVPGSFTGAREKRIGLLARANGGTFFLDEIDELPLETQVGLLGVLQERCFRPIGSNEEIRTEFRLITASNRDLEESLAEGKIREDFYHRVAHVVIHLPALRHRKEDIPIFSSHFLEALRLREGLSVFELGEEAREMLANHQWPGNVRELEAVVESAAFRAQYHGRQTILGQDIHLGSRRQGLVAEKGSFREQVEAFKRKLVLEAVEKCGGNQSQAARELALDRSSLRRVLTGD